MAGWDDLTCLNKARLLKQGALTNTALLLLGRSEASTLLAPAVAKVSWILKDADNRELDYPNVIVSGAMAKATGEAARHIRERGFNKQYYLDLIRALIDEHAPVGRREVDELLVPKLPERMNDQQKRRKVHNLLQELRRAGKIANQGTRAEPQWVSAWVTPAGETP